MKRTALLILLLFPLMLSAQENSNQLGYAKFRLGVEGGVGFFNGDMITQSALRASYDDLGYFTNLFNKLTPHYYIGVTSEYSFNTSLSLAAGLRFFGNDSELNSGWWNYFLWKMSETDLTTKYVRLDKLEQNNWYIGIPVEFTVFTYKRDIPVRHFFKAGVNFNFLLTSKTTPYFKNEIMNKYANEVVNGMEKNDVFVPTAFIGTGLKFGRMNRFFGLLEFRMPFALKGSFSSFAKSSIGFEVHTTMYFPVGKKKVYYISND